MRHLALLAGSVLVFTLLPAFSPAARADEEASEEADTVVEILTTESLALGDFLKVVGVHANVPFLWDPGARELARAQFTAARNIRVSRQGLFEFIRSVLASYDLVLVPIGPQGYQVYRVMAVGDMSGAAIVQPKFIELDRHNVEEYSTQHGLLVATTLRTEHVQDLASARAALLAHATGGGVGRIEPLPDLPGFAVTDFAPAVVAIRDALEQIDVPPPEPRLPARVTKRIDLAHADAEATARGFAAHLGANLPLPAREALTSATRKAPVLGLRILVDERTNALLVSGSPDRVAEVQGAVTLLDVPAETPSTWIHVYRLKHLAAVETALVLRELAADSGVLRAGGGAPPTTIVADVQGNTLLLEATPRVYEQLVALLQELDRPESADDDEER